MQHTHTHTMCIVSRSGAGAEGVAVSEWSMKIIYNDNI
jgi:hypothetical protein